MSENKSFNLNENLAVYKGSEESISTASNTEPVTIDFKYINFEKKRKRQLNGFILMGLGAFLGFVSCLLTVTNPIPELYNVILYGLTTFAIIIIMWGLYFVFE